MGQGVCDTGWVRLAQVFGVIPLHQNTTQSTLSGERPHQVWVYICGFNISILISVFMAAARPLFGPRRSVLLAIVVVALYTLLVGASASVVRAALMSSLALIAGRLGRRSWGLNTLAAAALLMTLQNPLVLWDVGFQLTSAATLGILLYGERLQAWVEALAARRVTAKRAQHIAAVAGELFLLTVAAQLTTPATILSQSTRYMNGFGDASCPKLGPASVLRSKAFRSTL